jgi:hypothetical protein
MLQHGTIHDSLYNAFSVGLFAAFVLESEDRELLQKLISEWRSQYRRPNDARLIGKSDEELIDAYYGTKEPDVIQ